MDIINKVIDEKKERNLYWIKFGLLIMCKKNPLLLSILLLCSWLLTAVSTSAQNTPRRLEILFLGHKAKNHDSEKLADILNAEYFRSGINLTYTTNPDMLNEQTLKPYDGLIVYANHDTISKSQEKALLDFVRQGKGLIALHSASFCFRNSDEVVEMIGGQFKSHKYGPFPAVIVKKNHPVMKDVPEFTTTDETYVHTKISKNIEVLSERVEGDHHEPYTWVRPYGKGRVFYTAYGHDEKTFNNEGFKKLVHNGILWAVGDEAAGSLAAFKLPVINYYEGMVPNYEKRDPAPKVQGKLTPEESMALIQVPVGFKLELFASEPMIKNPIYMNWDEKGRLWVIETVDYPNVIMDGDEGDDKIKILEDTDGDGKADKVTVFADKLNIPTSFVFANDGIILSQSPSFLFLKDTNGDDKADIRQEMLAGWGKADTHAQSSNLRYGVDNNIWGVVGYSGFRGSVGGDSLRFSNALFRFSPDGRKLEHMSNASNNTWGLGFTEDFDVFISTANNTHTAFLGMPKRYFDKADISENGIEKLDSHYGMHVAIKNLRQVDVHGGFTAAAGHSFYTARNFPKEYWNRYSFVTEPTGRLIHQNKIEPKGSGFKEGEDAWNIFTSGDEWAAPVQAEVGPDGSLWIADWYNFIIQHNPTPSAASSGIDAQNGKGNAYINPLRDVSMGRIYRLSYEGNNPGNTTTLSKKDTKGLLAALSNKNMFWRTTAQRLLVEKGDKKVLPELYRIVQTSKPDEIGVNPAAIHALWTMHGLGALNGNNKAATAVALGALTNPSAGVRKAAIEVLPKNATLFAALEKAHAFADTDYRIRLAAVLAITEMPSSKAIGNALVTMAEKEENLADSWIKHALNIASKIHGKEFREVALSRGLKEDATLSQASVVQRLIFGPRLSEAPLRRAFGRGNQSPLPNPSVKGNEFLFTGEIEKRNGGPAFMSGDLAGVIATQGNKENGYSLFIDNGKLNFQVNQEGVAYKATSAENVPNTFAFKAGLDKDGSLRLFIDSKEAGSAKAPGLFKADLPLGMRVGMDNLKGDDRVIAYPDSMFFLRGNLANGKLEILKGDEAKSSQSLENVKVDRTIVLEVVKDVMKFNKELLIVKAGTVVRLVLQNPDFMQHNFVLIKPGTSEKVGEAADNLARESNGAELHYVPKMPEVIAATELVNPGDEFTLTFRVPDEPGDYPYLCTFPGHWRIMNGILRITK